MRSLRAGIAEWQQRQIRVQGKGGPYGKKTKVRTVPMSLRVRMLLEAWFVLNDRFPVGPRRTQKIVKEIATGLRSAGKLHCTS